jgi:hypothetical protein
MIGRARFTQGHERQNDMGLLSLLTGKTIENVAGAAVDGIDSLILTDEERLKYHAKAAETHLEVTRIIAAESTPTAVSRRIIAVLVIGPFVLLKLASAVAYLCGWYGDAAHLNELSGDFEYAVIAVVTFYFGSHIVKGFKK